MIVRLDITPPFVRQDGDTFWAEGFVAEQVRAGNVIQSRTFDRRLSPSRVELTELVGTDTIDRIYLEVRSLKMAAAATNVSVTKSGDNYNFLWADGSGTPRTMEQLQNELAELQNEEMAQKIQRVMAYMRSGGGADMTSQVGVACTIDFAADNPVSFSD